MKIMSQNSCCTQLCVQKKKKTKTIDDEIECLDTDVSESLCRLTVWLF